MIAFMDESGVNPLPPGIVVSIAKASHPHTPVATGVIVAGGGANIGLDASTEYIATFSMAGQAPAVQAFFTSASVPTNPTAVSVSGYVSPVKSAADYAATSTGLLYPRGWFTAEASAPGGNAYAVALLFGSGLAKVDSLAQIVQGALRLPSCQGSQIDSWAYDFFGEYLFRFAGEPDSAYIGRIIAMLRLPKTTLGAIKYVVQAYYAAIQYELAPNAVQNLTFDQAGGYDSRGAFDETFQTPEGPPIIPTIDVFDAQSNPHLAQLYGIVPTEFCISIGDPPAKASELAYDTQGSYDTGQGGFDEKAGYVVSDAAPDPRLGAMVNFVKAEGFKPIYLVFDNQSSHTHVAA